MSYDTIEEQPTVAKAPASHSNRVLAGAVVVAFVVGVASAKLTTRTSRASLRLKSHANHAKELHNDKWHRLDCEQKENLVMATFDGDKEKREAHCVLAGADKDCLPPCKHKVTSSADLGKDSVASVCVGDAELSTLCFTSHFHEACDLLECTVGFVDQSCLMVDDTLEMYCLISEDNTLEEEEEESW